MTVIDPLAPVLDPVTEEIDAAAPAPGGRPPVPGPARRRRLIAVVAAVVVIATLAAVVVVARRDSGDESVATGPDRPPPAGTRSTATPSTSATTTTVAELPGELVPGEVEGVTPPAVATEEPAIDPCRASSDPACGDMVWDPPPAPNQPLTVRIVPSNPAPVIGEPVVFTVEWSDPDATLTEAIFGAGDGGPVLGLPVLVCRERFGLWEPPAPSSGAGSVTFSHVYLLPGTYRVTFSGLSRSTSDPCQNHDPYLSEASATIDLTVGLAPVAGA